MTPAARLRCGAGHIAAVRRMVEAGAPCADVLFQVRAVRGSLDAVARLLLAEAIRDTMCAEGPTEAVRLVRGRTTGGLNVPAGSDQGGGATPPGCRGHARSQ